MDEEIKNILAKNLEVSEKTFALLKKMRKEVVLGRMLHVAKWMVIGGFLVYGFIQVQPYLLYWSEVFSNIAKGIEKINSIFPGR